MKFEFFLQGHEFLRYALGHFFLYLAHEFIQICLEHLNLAFLGAKAFAVGVGPVAIPLRP